MVNLRLDGHRFQNVLRSLSLSKAGSEYPLNGQRDALYV
ncbi:Uncharacterised protein [Vibrio cholerae]|nr:Uncharacterised protein [Vibrio cholerae]